MLILLGGQTNARYVYLRLRALYFSFHDSQYDADLLGRGSGYDMMRGPSGEIRDSGGRF